MDITVTPVKHVTRHPALDQVLTMPINSVLLATMPSPYREDTIYDTILRTGESGWRSARREEKGYLDQTTVQDYVGRLVREEHQFALVQVKK